MGAVQAIVGLGVSALLLVVFAFVLGFFLGLGWWALSEGWSWGWWA